MPAISPTPHSFSAIERPVVQASRLDVNSLEVTVYQYFEASLTSITQKTYSAGIKKYLYYRSPTSFPANIMVLVSYLANNSLSHI